MKTNYLNQNDKLNKQRMIQLGNYLHRQRILKGYRLVDVANALGTSQPYISNIENGKNGLRFNVFMAGRLADLYDITVDDIYRSVMTDDEIKKRNEIIDYDGLNADKRNCINVDDLDNSQVLIINKIINELKTNPDDANMPSRIKYMLKFYQASNHNAESLI